ncbi:neuronal membrane glycoprotein M6-b-like [Antedon mediterranea]|uniref:neuronal membrane glycoprotein M6-b-like n=1 Tax=Antedon mediterranea TaxID=105859 RepID=UPI003AF9237A
MVSGGSVSTFDSSFIGGLYGDKEDDEDANCCSRCCQRYPWPSITSGLFIIGGIIVWCASVTIASREVLDLFRSTVAYDELDQMMSIAQYATYGSTAFMLILGLVLISMGCLATGAVRRYHMCRFRNRTSAIFQTKMFLIITYFVFLGWLGVLVVSMFPLVFFTVQKQGNCQTESFTLNTCVDLEQWGFVDEDEKEEDPGLCQDDLERLCTGNLRLLFFIATMSAVLICVGLAQFLATLSFNSAKLRHGYKSHNRGKSGSYNLRSSYRAGSFRSTKNNRASKESITQVQNTGPYPSQDSIDRLKREYAAQEYPYQYQTSRERLNDYSQQGSRDWDYQGQGSHELTALSTLYGGNGSESSTIRTDRDAYDGRYEQKAYQREYHI